MNVGQYTSGSVGNLSVVYWNGHRRKCVSWYFVTTLQCEVAIKLRVWSMSSIVSSTEAICSAPPGEMSGGGAGGNESESFVPSLSRSILEKTWVTHLKYQSLSMHMIAVKCSVPHSTQYTYLDYWYMFGIHTHDTCRHMTPCLLIHVHKWQQGEEGLGVA